MVFGSQNGGSLIRQEVTRHCRLLVSVIDEELQMPSTNAGQQVSRHATKGCKSGPEGEPRSL